MVKKLLVALIIFFSCECVYALDFCSPSKEYLEYMALSDEEKANYIEPIYCNEIIGTSSLDHISTGSNLTSLFPNVTNKGVSNSSILEPYYSSVDQGYISPAEHQLGTGMCWGFSAMSAVETNATKNNAGTYNFSEAHLGYSILGKAYTDESGKNGRYNADARYGGQITYSPSYFFGDYGQRLEKDMVFYKNLNEDYNELKQISSSSYQKGTSMISVEGYHLSLNSTCTADTIVEVKSKILEYGSVQATMFMDETLFKDTDENYYLSTTNDGPSVNHGVLIVGWDDTIPKEKFGASRDGAWIIQNSWGATWSGDGLFYISYDDSFICRMMATYSGVSTKTFDHTYQAADLIGAFDLYFKGTNYYSTKFTKKSANQESLDRVSFPVAAYTDYNVYLSKDNSLNQDNWQLLTSGTAYEYGMESIDLADIYLDNDFTIIVETIAKNSTTSVLTTCIRNSDISHLDISSNTNYSSADGKTWEDMKDKGCEPDIYAYTSDVDSNINLEINSLSNFNDIISIKISRANVTTSEITYQVVNNNQDMTKNFTIIPNYPNNEIYIISDNTVSGTFSFNIEYGDINISKEFKLVEKISSASSNLKIKANTIIIAIPRNTTFTYQDLIDNLNIENTAITIDTNNVGTNTSLITNTNTYKIVIMGDVSGDGTINSADLMKIVKYLKGNNNLTPEQLLAADPTKDNTINSADLMRIVKFLKGTANIGL